MIPKGSCIRIFFYEVRKQIRGWKRPLYIIRSGSSGHGILKYDRADFRDRRSVVWSMRERKYRVRDRNSDWRYGLTGRLYRLYWLHCRPSLRHMHVNVWTTAYFNKAHTRLTGFLRVFHKIVPNRYIIWFLISFFGHYARTIFIYKPSTCVTSIKRQEPYSLRSDCCSRPSVI